MLRKVGGFPWSPQAETAPLRALVCVSETWSDNPLCSRLRRFLGTGACPWQWADPYSAQRHSGSATERAFSLQGPRSSADSTQELASHGRMTAQAWSERPLLLGVWGCWGVRPPRVGSARAVSLQPTQSEKLHGKSQREMSHVSHNAYPGLILAARSVIISSHLPLGFI